MLPIFWNTIIASSDAPFPSSPKPRRAREKEPLPASSESKKKLADICQIAETEKGLARLSFPLSMVEPLILLFDLVAQVVWELRPQRPSAALLLVCVADWLHHCRRPPSKISRRPCLKFQQRNIDHEKMLWNTCIERTEEATRAAGSLLTLIEMEGERNKIVVLSYWRYQWSI